MLPHPPVVVDVSALDLVGRSGCSPDEAFGEADLRCDSIVFVHGRSLYRLRARPSFDQVLGDGANRIPTDGDEV